MVAAGQSVLLDCPAAANASVSTSATSRERLIRRFLARFVTRWSKPSSRLNDTRLNPLPTFGRPLFRRTFFHCSRSAGVKGRDSSITNGLSNCSVASESSVGLIFQYGFDFVISFGGDISASPGQSEVGRGSHICSHRRRVRRSLGGIDPLDPFPIPAICRPGSFSERDFEQRQLIAQLHRVRRRVCRCARYSNRSIGTA